ncbi:MAG: 3-dehydroquinate synthase [Chloroflexota bacterium]
MSQPTIVLTGFMGTGKSTVGRALAARTGRTFIDTDELIEQRTGRAIAEIFADEGELFFRQWESKIAQELGGQPDLVIATGGRLMLDPLNAAALGHNALVFCLTAEPEEIVARLQGDAARRPLLQSPNVADRIRQLLSGRAQAYGRFPQVSTSRRTVEEVVEEIVQRSEGQVAGGKWQVASVAQAAGLQVASGRWQVASDGEAKSKIQNPKSKIEVHYPGGRYDILVGEDLLPHLEDLVGFDGPVAIITDSNVGPLYAGRCGPISQQAAAITIPAGEPHKNLDTVRAIYDQLAAVRFDRQGTIVALGGGVVGDVAGFVAATYLRGVRLVQCPTSLLAMVDASIGGKTGVDLPAGKNLVGAFKQPAAVVADLATLSTLPPLELACGLAEVVKSGLIGDPAILEELAMNNEQLPMNNEQLPMTNYQPLILRAIQVKRAVVQADPYEQGQRAILNLGHTFGHAIEQVSHYAIRHGQAVAIGLVAASHLSAALGHCPPELPKQIATVLERLGLPTQIPADLPATDLLAAMGSDKKRAGGRLRFVLMRDVGDVFVSSDVPEAAVLGALRSCHNLRC